MTQPRRVLFVTLLNDPGSDRIVSETGRLGAHCAVVGPIDAFAAKSRFVQRIFPLPTRGGGVLRSLLLGRRLEGIIAAWSPDMIVPTDDLAARVLRDGRLFRRAGPKLRSLIEFSLGAAEFFDAACSRQALMEVAQRVGVRTPRTAAAPNLAAAKCAAAAFGYPVVLKRELSCGGAGVTILHSEVDLVRAFRREWVWAQAKRRLGWIPGYRVAEAVPLSLQEFIPGALAFRVSACAGGLELEGADFVAERRGPWETGASTLVRCFSHESMREAARKIVAALKCSGFVSLDFIIKNDEEAYLLELNARPIACGHLGRLFGHDILAAALGRGGVAPPSRPGLSRPPDIVALFPRELDREPRSLDLAPGSNVYHDVPWEDREVVEAYSAWLDRRHPDRRPVLKPQMSLSL